MIHRLTKLNMIITYDDAAENAFGNSHCWLNVLLYNAIILHFPIMLGLLWARYVHFTFVYFNIAFVYVNVHFIFLYYLLLLMKWNLINFNCF